MMGGFYSLTAEADSGKGSISNLGSYLAAYHYNFLEGLDFSVGYSLFFSNIVSGDIGYGPDLGFTYFPFTPSTPIQMTAEFERVYYRDVLRPFVNVSFNQRQFQSVEAAYAGFSFAVGTEYYWNSVIDLKGLLRYQLLQGPQGSRGSYMDALIGVSFGI